MDGCFEVDKLETKLTIGFYMPKNPNQLLLKQNIPQNQNKAYSRCIHHVKG